jgi:hypothetical protein
MLETMGMGKESRRVRWGTRITIPSDPEVKEALTMARDRLRRSGRLRFRGMKLTQEAVFGALCLWADAQEAAGLEAALAPFVARLEAVVAASEAHEKTPEGAVEGVTIVTKNRAPTRGARPDPKGRSSGLQAERGREAG